MSRTEERGEIGAPGRLNTENRTSDELLCTSLSTTRSKNNIFVKAEGRDMVNAKAPEHSLGPDYRPEKPMATVSTKVPHDNVHILPQTPQLIALLT